MPRWAQPGPRTRLLAPDGQSYATTSLVDVRPPIADWLRQNRPDERSAFRRWRAGEGAFLEAFEPGVVGRDYIDLARARRRDRLRRHPGPHR